MLHINLCRGKSKLAQSVMIVVFVLREKITLGSRVTNGFEIVPMGLN